MKPVEVRSKNEILLLKTVYNRIKKFQLGRYKVGDYVRISKSKGIFGKGYMPNWSTNIFKIQKINMTNPVTYTLTDLKDDMIIIKFYDSEIQKTNNINIVEKILKRKGNKVYIKWLGFDHSENSWINKSDIL